MTCQARTDKPLTPRFTFIAGHGLLVSAFASGIFFGDVEFRTCRFVAGWQMTSTVSGS